jgi:hypothetical protein
LPKAGKYDYPELDLDACIEKLRKVREVARNDVVKRETVADILGLKPKSGWFNTIVGALSQYGLVEAREGEVRITELAKTLIYGEPSEVAKAKAQAVKNIELFRDLYEQYGLSLTDEQLRIFLKEKAYVDVSEVQSLTEKIGKMYKKVALYLSAAEGGEPTPKVAYPSVGGVGLGEKGESSSVLGSVVTTFGQIKITDKETLELARRLLDILERQISKKGASDERVQ